MVGFLSRMTHSLARSYRSASLSDAPPPGIAPGNPAISGAPPSPASSVTPSTYSGAPCERRKSPIFVNSLSSINAPWIRTGTRPASLNSISPHANNCSAPPSPRHVTLSIRLRAWNDTRVGKFALITPVIVVASGLCVAITR